jgi:hypothetical protein
MKMQLNMHLIDVKWKCKKMVLIINYDKTKYMETGKPTKEKYIRRNNRHVEKVNQFKYLGSIIIIVTILWK